MAGLPESAGLAGGGRPRQQPPQALTVSEQAPDVNLYLTGASDWGAASGVGGGGASTAALPFAKPSERLRELEGEMKRLEGGAKQGEGPLLSAWERRGFTTDDRPYFW